MDDSTVLDAIAVMGARSRGEHVAVDRAALADALARLRAEELGLAANPVVGAAVGHLPGPVKDVLRRVRTAARRGTGRRR